MTNETVFPTTQGTWLRTQVEGMNAVAGNPALAAAARINANAYVMERYAGPLAVFVRGSSLSRLGEPEELVNGFFASRLSDAAFLAGWSRSGMRLRRWLMNGMLFYGQGVARDRMRAAARGGLVEPRELDERAGADVQGESDFERACVRCCEGSGASSRALKRALKRAERSEARAVGGRCRRACRVALPPAQQGVVAASNAPRAFRLQSWRAERIRCRHHQR